MDGILEGLNGRQKEAVLHGEGPLLIVAGAGTGKTTVLTRRIAHLIASKQAVPREILALTFTDKAAQEMEDRVDRLVPYGFNDVSISTFHSFGDRILRENALDLGLSPDVHVLSRPEAAVFMRENLFRFKLKRYRPLADPTQFIESLLTTFSRAKDEEATPQDYLESARKKLKSAKTKQEKEKAEKVQEAALAFELYEKLKTERGFIDFGDQVLLTLKLLREQSSILKKIQSQFRFIVVDEFQDTNFAQFDLLKVLAGKSRNITVVGDDDQSIYKFRGACLSNILGFRKAYPEASQIVLQENYRSTQPVLDAAYRLIQHNNPDRLEYRDRINKMLIGRTAEGPSVEHRRFDAVFSECEHIASAIGERLKIGPAEPKNFAVLVRTNAAAEPYLKALNLAGIPWNFSGNSGLYELEEIRTILSFLRAIDDPADSPSHYYLAASNLYDMDAEDLTALTQASGRTRRPLSEIFRNHRTLAPEIELESQSEKKISGICEDLSRFRKLSMKVPTGVLLYQYLDEKGVFRRLADSSDWQAAQEAQNLQSFFGMIKRFSQVSRYDRLHSFVSYLEALRQAGEDPSSSDLSHDDNAVRVLTVHAAKGLEFDTVFLAGLEQERFPARNRPERIEIPDDLVRDILPSGGYHLQEERRLFYVGMTRAKTELIFTSARNLGGRKSWKPSQFVLEALDLPAADEKTVKVSPLDSLKIFSGHVGNARERSVQNGRERSLPQKTEILLSATAMEDYLRCPLRYKFARVVKIPVLLHHTAVFGTAVHEALKTYHIARRDDKSFGLKNLLGIFENSWKSEGFISREHEDKRFQEGLNILRGHYKREQKSKSRPSFVEESFKMSAAGAKILGRWDRIDLGAESAVIDYKTSDVKDEKAAHAKAKESRQLGLYALAFEKKFGKLPDKLTLHFVKFGIEGTVRPTPQWMEGMLEDAVKAVQGVTQGNYDPNPSYGCRTCPYEKICPALRKG